MKNIDDFVDFKMTPRSLSEAHIKQRALNKATMNMAAQLKSMEENMTLQKKLRSVKYIFLTMKVLIMCQYSALVIGFQTCS